MKKALPAMLLLIGPCFADELVPIGQWDTPTNLAVEEISICVEPDLITLTRWPKGMEREVWSSNNEGISVFDDAVIVEFGVNQRVFFKLLGIIRGRDNEKQLIGSLHMYMHGLTHMNRFQVFLEHVSVTCSK